MVGAAGVAVLAGLMLGQVLGTVDGIVRVVRAGRAREPDGSDDDKPHLASTGGRLG